MESAHLRGNVLFKPCPYVEIIVDEDISYKTEPSRNTSQPKWNEKLTLLVKPHSKINFCVLDKNSFRKDTIIGEKKLDLLQLLKIYNGRCDNLELTIDLYHELKPGEYASKVGELICLLQGLVVDLSKYVGPGSSNMALTPSNSDVDLQRNVVLLLSGIKAKLRTIGVENVVPTRPSFERPTPVPSTNVAPIPMTSTSSISNGMFYVISGIFGNQVF